MIWKIFILMLLCHVIGDFVLQTDKIANLKQKTWWKENCSEEELKKYKDDYKMALLMHCILWSAMVLLPVILCVEISGLALYFIFIGNVLIHYVTDDLKANYKEINLVEDQTIHLLQILLTFLIICIIL